MRHAAHPRIWIPDATRGRSLRSAWLSACRRAQCSVFERPVLISYEIVKLLTYIRTHLLLRVGSCPPSETHPVLSRNRAAPPYPSASACGSSASLRPVTVARRRVGTRESADLRRRPPLPAASTSYNDRALAWVRRIRGRVRYRSRSPLFCLLYSSMYALTYRGAMQVNRQRFRPAAAGPERVRRV